MEKIIGIAACLVACSLAVSNPFLLQPELDIAAFSGAVGDGITDDTAQVQLALTKCSNEGLTCVIGTGKNFLITSELYLWGDANLLGRDDTSRLSIQTGTIPYVLNIGISGVNQIQPVWHGTIMNVTFIGVDNGTGRLIFFWRADGIRILENTFLIGNSAYGPTSSGNNANILTDGPGVYVRKNALIADNVILANGENASGNEGIGLNQWDGADITRNIVTGVADDMIGIHFSRNIRVYENEIAGIDGRLFIANSSNVTIRNNKVARIASPTTGEWFVGVALIYIGHEGDISHTFEAPTLINVQGNQLTYNAGAIDNGAAIFIFSPRLVTVQQNIVINNSATASDVGIHILPFTYVNGTWNDPAGLDTNVARVYETLVRDNNLTAGTFSTRLIETGQTCAYYFGPINIGNNVAKSFSFICNPFTEGNVAVG